jgi:hypothetical protein
MILIYFNFILDKGYFMKFTLLGIVTLLISLCPSMHCMNNNKRKGNGNFFQFNPKKPLLYKKQKRVVPPPTAIPPLLTKKITFYQTNDTLDERDNRFFKNFKENEIFRVFKHYNKDRLRDFYLAVIIPKGNGSNKTVKNCNIGVNQFVKEGDRGMIFALDRNGPTNLNYLNLEDVSEKNMIDIGNTIFNIMENNFEHRRVFIDFTNQPKEKKFIKECMNKAKMKPFGGINGHTYNKEEYNKKISEFRGTHNVGDISVRLPGLKGKLRDFEIKWH